MSIPSFLQAFNHLSPVKYALGNMAPYTLRGIRFTCEESQKINGQCPITTGEQALDLYKLNGNPEMNIMGLGICALVYRILAYVILKMVKERWLGRLWRKVGAKRKKRMTQVSTGDESAE